MNAECGKRFGDIAANPFIITAKLCVFYFLSIYVIFVTLSIKYYLYIYSIILQKDCLFMDAISLEP